MTSYFILTVVDSTTTFTVAAHKIAAERLAKGVWPLYSKTQNRNAIAPGDRVLVYVGGKLRYSQSFVAAAQVTSVDPVGRRLPTIDAPEIVTKPPFKVVRLARTAYFEPPIEIRPLLGELDFLPPAKEVGRAARRWMPENRAPGFSAHTSAVQTC
jgi:hypothetical protein